MKMGYSRKNPPPPPPRRMAKFFDPPPTRISWISWTPPAPTWISKAKDPLSPGFPLFFTSPKFILQAIENIKQM